MQVNLFINGQEIDLQPEMNITLAKQFYTEDQYIVKNAEYSYSIDIPASLKNKQIFQFADNVDVAKKFEQVYDAVLYAGEMVVLNGKLIMTEINGDTYKCNLYLPAKADINNILSDRDLNNIKPHYKFLNNYDDYTRINNYVLGEDVDEEFLPPEDQRDDHICYPYVLYHLPYADASITNDELLDKTVQFTDFNKTNITPDNVYPAFKVTSVLKDMFAADGYKLQGNIFDNDKIDKLYQTFSGDNDLMATKRNTPYYVSFDLDYRLMRPNESGYNISNTASVEKFFEKAEEWQDDFQFGIDNLFVSDNTILSNVSNNYGMLAKGKEGGYILRIPRSGWYVMQVTGNLILPTRSGSYDQNDRTRVTGWLSADDDTSFSSSMYELQFNIGNALENTRFVSSIWGQPQKGVEFNKGESAVIYPGENNKYNIGVELINNATPSTYFFPKNGNTLPVRNVGDKANNFICGARFGDQVTGIYTGKYTKIEEEAFGPNPVEVDMENLPYWKYNRNRFSPEAIFYELPRTDVAFADVMEDDSKYLRIREIDRRKTNKYQVGTTYVHSTQMALALQRQSKNYYSFNGYNVWNNENNVWDTSSNNPVKVHGCPDSTALVSGLGVNGFFMLYNCVWLEEGDLIQPEVLMPFNYNQDHYGSSGIKHTYKRGVTDTSVNFSFMMGFVSGDEKYTPTEQEPLTFDRKDLQAKRLTNVNALLPNVKCNDYLNNFLQTFNCRLTNVDDTTYSIDYQGKQGMGDIFNLDNITSLNDITLKSIDSPSKYTIGWSIDQEEEGYVNGNPTADQAFKYNRPHHKGEKVIKNQANTTGKEVKKESQWSYNWYHNITLKGDAMDGEVISVPVVTEADIWGDRYLYSAAQEDVELNTEAASRLFYVNGYVDFTDADSDYEQPVHYVNKLKLRLVVPSNELNGNLIDYDNSLENTREIYTTLSDNYFTLVLTNKYQIDVKVILPNYIYSKINSNSLFKLNDGLYRVKEIKGHKIQEDGQSTLSLINI